MLNALLISVHARFVREISRLPVGVEVVVCSAGATTSRDYTDFSETEALMAAGRAEALDVLVRHGVIPAPPKEEAPPAAPEVVDAGGADDVEGDEVGGSTVAADEGTPSPEGAGA
jgi:hypothetical protein